MGLRVNDATPGIVRDPVRQGWRIERARFGRHATALAAATGTCEETRAIKRTDA